MPDLTVTTDVAAEVDAVWAAFTTPALARWFWPPSFHAEAAIEPTAGGAVRIRSSVADMGLTGVVTAVDAPHRLAFTWLWDGEDVGTDVELTLQPHDRATSVTVVHRGFADATSRDEHITGWRDCLARLEPFLRA